jgi:hypothetical protein
VVYRDKTSSHDKAKGRGGTINLGAAGEAWSYGPPPASLLSTSALDHDSGEETGGDQWPAVMAVAASEVTVWRHGQWRGRQVNVLHTPLPVPVCSCLDARLCGAI